MEKIKSKLTQEIIWLLSLITSPSQHEALPLQDIQNFCLLNPYDGISNALKTSSNTDEYSNQVTRRSALQQAKVHTDLI